MTRIIGSIAIVMLGIAAPGGAAPLPVPDNSDVPLGPPGAPRSAVPDYLNLTTFQGFYLPWSQEIADDIHRTTNLDIVGIEIGYSSALDTVDATLQIYPISQEDEWNLPVPLLGSYSFAGLPGGDHEFAYLELPEPLTAPQDIWVGLTFHDLADTSGLLMYFPWTLGYSHNWYAYDSDGNGRIDTIESGSGSVYRDFAIGVYVVPEPSALVLLFLGYCVALGAQARRARPSA